MTQTVKLFVCRTISQWKRGLRSESRRAAGCAVFMAHDGRCHGSDEPRAALPAAKQVKRGRGALPSLLPSDIASCCCRKSLHSLVSHPFQRLLTVIFTTYEASYPSAPIYQYLHSAASPLLQALRFVSGPLNDLCMERDTSAPAKGMACYQLGICNKQYPVRKDKRRPHQCALRPEFPVFRNILQRKWIKLLL